MDETTTIDDALASARTLNRMLDLRPGLELRQQLEKLSRFPRDLTVSDLARVHTYACMFVTGKLEKLDWEDLGQLLGRLTAMLGVESDLALWGVAVEVAVGDWATESMRVIADLGIQHAVLDEVVEDLRKGNP
jgi:hypothetical protein